MDLRRSANGANAGHPGNDHRGVPEPAPSGVRSPPVRALGGPHVRADALARLADHRRTGFDAGLAASRAVWEERWADCDVQIDGDAEATRAVRFGIYHLLIAADPRMADFNTLQEMLWHLLLTASLNQVAA